MDERQERRSLVDYDVDGSSRPAVVDAGTDSDAEGDTDRKGFWPFCSNDSESRTVENNEDLEDHVLRNWVLQSFQLSAVDGKILIQFPSECLFPPEVQHALLAGRLFERKLIVVHHPSFCGLCRAEGRGDRFLQCVKVMTFEGFELMRPEAPSGDPHVVRLVGRSIDQESGTLIWALPIIKVQCRTTIFNIASIDTVEQSFQADMFVELRIGSVANSASAPADEFMKAVGLNPLTMPTFLNMYEAIGVIERDHKLAISVHKGTFDLVITVRTKAKFTEAFELQNFPFDLQSISINISMGVSARLLRLEANREAPSTFSLKNFSLGSVWHPSLEDLVIGFPGLSDPSASSFGTVYPSLTFQLFLRRMPGYYISNVMIPMAFLTLLSLLSFDMFPETAPMTKTDRLSVTLTLMLTAVAYKLVAASNLPRLSYLTTMDEYMLVCFAFMMLASVENVLYPALIHIDSLPPEWTIGAVYFGSFTLLNAVWWTVNWIRNRKAHALLDAQFELERLHRVAFKAALNSSDQSPREHIEKRALWLIERLLSKASRLTQFLAQQPPNYVETYLAGADDDAADGSRNTLEMQSKMEKYVAKLLQEHGGW